MFALAITNVSFTAPYHAVSVPSPEQCHLPRAVMVRESGSSRLAPKELRCKDRHHHQDLAVPCRASYQEPHEFLRVISYGVF